MTTIPLSKLLQDISELPNHYDLAVTGLALDSRLVQPGEVFFACQGTHLDGRKFIHQAIQNGASVVLAEQNAEQTVMYWQDSVLILPIIHLKRQLS